MRLANQYIIPFKGLAEGDHEFEFDLEKAFFDEHEILEARNGFIKVIVLLNKTPQLLTLNFELNGNIEIACDRCLEYFNFPIHLRSQLVVKFSENSDEIDEEIWYINPNENELDLEQYYFDIIAVNMPLQKVHPSDPNGSGGCDKDMLKLLNKHVISEDQKGIDPRWDKLKNLLNDYNNN